MTIIISIIMGEEGPVGKKVLVNNIIIIVTIIISIIIIIIINVPVVTMMVDQRGD